jgi:hypothetical protein
MRVNRQPTRNRGGSAETTGKRSNTPRTTTALLMVTARFYGADKKVIDFCDHDVDRIVPGRRRSPGMTMGRLALSACPRQTLDHATAPPDRSALHLRRTVPASARCPTHLLEEPPRRRRVITANEHGAISKASIPITVPCSNSRWCPACARNLACSNGPTSISPSGPISTLARAPSSKEENAAGR